MSALAVEYPEVRTGVLACGCEYETIISPNDGGHNSWTDAWGGRSYNVVNEHRYTSRCDAHTPKPKRKARTKAAKKPSTTGGFRVASFDKRKWQEREYESLMGRKWSDVDVWPTVADFGGPAYPERRTVDPVSPWATSSYKRAKARKAHAEESQAAYDEWTREYYGVYVPALAAFEASPAYQDYLAAVKVHTERSAQFSYTGRKVRGESADVQLARIVPGFAV